MMVPKPGNQDRILQLDADGYFMRRVKHVAQSSQTSRPDLSGVMQQCRSQAKETNKTAVVKCIDRKKPAVA